MYKQILVKEDDEVFKHRLETPSKQNSPTIKLERHHCLGSCVNFTMHNVIKDLKESCKATLICTICGYRYDFVW
jgi:hypothetical protein